MVFGGYGLYFGRATGVITDLTRGGSPRRFQLGLNYGFEATPR